MISIRRLFLSLVLLGGCAQESDTRSDREAGADDRPLAQVASSGTRDWLSVGGTANSGPAICSWEAGHFDVFVRGSDNAIWQRTWDQGTWSEWTSLGGSTVSDPAAISTEPGRIDLFARARDNQLYRKIYSNGKWASDWERLGGALASSPAVTSSGGGRLDVFARGTDGGLWQKTFTNSWGSWKSINSSFSLTSDPAAVSWGEGRIDVVARGTTGDLNQVTFSDGRWGKWTSLGKNLTSLTAPPTSWLSALNTLLGVTFPRSAEELWLRWVVEMAANANAELTTAPALASWGPGRLDLFATSQDGTLWQRTFADGKWGELVPLGGRATSAPDAVSSANGQIDLVVRGTGNAVIYKYYDGSW